MSEDRLERLEDMMGQLIGMVSKILAEQQDMRKDIQSINARLNRVESGIDEVKAEQIRHNDSTSYTLQKLGQHDHDIHILNSKMIK